jgi:hypothetical protein
MTARAASAWPLRLRAFISTIQRISKNRITDETLKLLLQLAEASSLRARIGAMFQS